MSDVTVSQLAETTGTPPERLLKQMQEAGLPHTALDESVSDDQKQTLLAHLKRSRGESESVAPKKITLQRKTVSKLKTGQGRGGRVVNVEVRKKRTYVKRKEPVAEPEETLAEEATAEIQESAPAASPVAPSTAESEAALSAESAQAMPPQSDEVDSTEASPEIADAEAVAEPAPPVEPEAPADAVELAESIEPAEEAPEEVPEESAQSEVADTHSDADLQAAEEAVESAQAATPAENSEAEAAPKTKKLVRKKVRRVPISAAKQEMLRIQQEEQSRKDAAHREAARIEADRRAREDAERLKKEQEEAAKARVEAEAQAAKTAKANRGAAPPKPAGAAGESGPPPDSAAERRGGRRRGGGRRDRGGPQESLGFGDGARRGGKGRKGRRSSVDVPTVQAFEKPTEFIVREVELSDMINVGELAQQMTVKAGEVIKTLMGLGVMATINQSIDQDTATLVVEEMGHKVKIVVEDKLEHDLAQSLQIEGDEAPRPPVVTVMGHVDHGKTSLLDYIRKTRVALGEAGGITQHIGAYHVETDQGVISFLDTPGHAAFTSMRARGARFTDVVILVVAADDGVMPQTEEAVQHARAAGVPLVVAVNKMDKEGADPERVKNDLAARDVIPEDWGGDTQFVPVSAHTGEGIDTLLEAVLLQAELQELKGVPEAPARGVVLESRLDRGRGPVATLLVLNGTLNKTDIVVAGQYFGRVRAMLDENGQPIETAGPSIPVEILGLSGTPDAGDEFSAATDEKTAREVAEFRKVRDMEQRQAMQRAAKMENMFAGIGDGEKRIMNIVLKADVRGSLEAIQQAAADLGNDEVAVNIIGAGVGGINESDANLALTSGSVLFGFNVRADTSAKKIIEREGIDLRYYSVIYEMLDDIKQVLSGMLAPETREEIVGVAQVRDVFRSPKFGQVAGCMVVEGTVFRNKRIRVLRDNVVIFEGELESLRRFKDDVNEVRNGLECGIAVRSYNDVRDGDKIEVFDSKEVAREL